MFILTLFLCIIMIYTMKYNKDDIYEDYMSIENTASIKGIFVLMVFMSHICSYTSFKLLPDRIIITILGLVSQLMVAMFLFYSGYGVHESIKRKGEDYIAHFPKHRILRTFINFALAVTLFWGLRSLIGRTYSIERILLSYIGIKNFGNSSWYMFAIIVLYILTYISYILIKRDDKQSLILFTVISLFYVFVASRYLPSRYSNTFLCYGVGMWYSYYKDSIDGWVQNNHHYLSSLLISILLFTGYGILLVLLFHKDLRGMPPILYDIFAILFSMTTVFLSMKIIFKSKILSWFGHNVFWIYILQRIPMIYFERIGLDKYNYLYLFICLVSSIVLAVIFREISNRLMKVLRLA